ncbi:N-6 DNA methylase [Mesorhizobium sp. B2-4-12]|uniref:HsdM family class I SAM-dependent methyltransferase n=1 Tax=Mesorhizobium sp. B2-4-12 TaxID=2589937 RepID=UPI0015E3934B|nr:N-6 DNA methylase [Mesorhizobium sp. B2-4-12]
MADDIDPVDASSWVWSSNIPHHVLMTGDRVRVLRWDRPDETSEFDISRVLSNPIDFYEHLRSDRTTDRRTIVEHSLSLFQRVRNLVHHADLPDEKSIAAYLALLGVFAGGQQPTKRNLAAVDNGFQVPDGSKEVVSLLPQGEVEAIYNEYQSLRLGNRSIATDVSLAIRHASGAIFQEAHHVLIQGPPPDLFNYVAPATARKPDRGGVHFTPPFLARALSEQVLQALGDLKNRNRLVIADIACGSAAFLVEALRALERLDYRGHITLVGRDMSPVAIDMARFVLGVAGQEWPGKGRIKLDLEIADSLRDVPNFEADAVVMNPPFTRWQELDANQRELLSTVVGKSAGGRPDLSTAFVERALDILKPGGAIATLLPANALDAKSASTWRNKLLDRKHVFLSALFDDHSIFSHARVRVGALVLSSNSVKSTIRIHAGSDAENAGDALRALRLKRWNSDENEGFSLSLIPAAKTSGATRITAPDWSESLGRRRPLTKHVQQSFATTVKDVFDVRQGIRTGENTAFVLDRTQWLDLPESEKTFFRPAISSKGIMDGRVTQLFYVFYPYGREHSIGAEPELLRQLPRFSARYLEPFRRKLSGRRAKADKWWELSERRSGMENSPPAFVSKYWAKPGGFVHHAPTQAVVLQGFGWVLRKNTVSHLQPSERIHVELAYLSLLNSEAFFNLVAEHAPPTGGGQFDMSPRYVLDVPLIDLFNTGDYFAREIDILAKYAYSYYEQSNRGPDVEARIVEAAASKVLGLRSGSPTVRPVQNEADSSLPDWLRPFVETGYNGTDRAYRVRVLAKLQELARSGEYSEIDAALNQAPISQLAETSLMTLLRGSYRFKTKLKDWDGFRDRVASELGKRGAAVNRLLIGLYE